MNLAKRVRDCRYAKGWGPDELASRAEISRTALYQIECGKTETPRAGTLRRIARALEIPIDALIAEDIDPTYLIATSASTAEDEPAGEAGEASPAKPKRDRAFTSLEALDILNREATSGYRTPRASYRRRELERMLQELLSSPLGEGVARIIEDAY